MLKAILSRFDSFPPGYRRKGIANCKVNMFHISLTVLNRLPEIISR